MCGAQQLQFKSESTPQIIGAHQPQQACNEYTHTGWKRRHIGWDRIAPLSVPRSLGTGALFLISVSGRGGGGGTAISFATRLHGICNASHNRMEEGTHLGHLSYCPTFGLGISAPPPPLVSEFCLERYSSVLSSVTRLQGI